MHIIPYKPHVHLLCSWHQRSICSTHFTTTQGAPWRNLVTSSDSSTPNKTPEMIYIYKDRLLRNWDECMSRYDIFHTTYEKGKEQWKTIFYIYRIQTICNKYINPYFGENWICGSFPNLSRHTLLASKQNNIYDNRGRILK